MVVCSSMSIAQQLSRLREWCREQGLNPDAEYELRLLEGTPLTRPEIEAIPSYPSSFQLGIPDTYDPNSFVVPESYKELLSIVGGFQLEYRDRTGDEEEKEEQQRRWHVYPLLHLFRPGLCSRAHMSGSPSGLCDSWSSCGTTVNGRELSTTKFLSFAMAGDTVELSRWCFFLEGTKEPTIYFENNDYECDLGHWADTGEWINSEHTSCYFQCFTDWFAAIIDVLCSAPFDPEENEERLDAILNHPLGA